MRRLFLFPFALGVLTISGRSLSPCSADAPAAFVDPAPPKVALLPDAPPPAPAAQPELKFHAAPKPLAPGAVTSDWCTFLGPGHNGLSTETPLLKQFGKSGPTLLWEVTKGEGFAAPAVIGERVVLFHRLADQEVVECLQAETGKRFWKFAYPTDYQDRYGFNGGPRCPPVSDGKYVYTYGAGGKLHCLKLTTGQVLWERDLSQEFKVPQGFFGVGATPLIEGDLLIVNVGAPGGPCVVAFDKLTGKAAWGAGDEWGPSYASPIPATVHGKRRVFVFAGGESRPSIGGLLCLDPANGKIDFSFPWRARVYESVNASAPLVLDDRVYISECYGPGEVLLNLSPDGTAHQLWTNNVLNTHFSTAIHKDGYLYGLDGHGPQNVELVCVDLQTGKEMWRKTPQWDQTVKASDGERKVMLEPGLASLILVDGRCLMLTDTGELLWLDFNPKGYHELDRAHLFFAPETFSMPALSRGLLFVNQCEMGLDDSPPRLLCYDLRGMGK